MEHYGNDIFWGMNLIWWVLWIIVLLWIFAAPYHIPGQRFKKETPLDLLNKRFILGEITSKEYEEKKKLITT
jgi:putative membrane protein